MKYNHKNLYVNIPIRGALGGYIFSLEDEDIIYTDFDTALRDRKDGEETVTLERAIGRITSDVHADV